MRTTIAIDDNILEEAKRRAARQQISLGRFVEDALRRAFVREMPDDRPSIPIFRGGTGVRSGVDVTSNRSLYEALDEGHGLDELR